MKFLNVNISYKKNFILKKNLNYCNYINFFYYKDLEKKACVNLTNFISYSKNSLSIKERKNYIQFVKIKNLVSFFLKNGSFLKISIEIFKVFSKMFNLFGSLNNNILEKNYKYFKEFFYNFSIFRNYNNLNYLNNWIFEWNELLFAIDCTVVPKKYRKKLKKKYLYKVKYLNKTKRLFKVLNWFVKYSNSIKNYSLNNRIFLVYLDTILNYKNSYIYNKKLLVYKKIFKI